VSVTIQLRGDTAADWTSTNPVLFAREFGIETDTGKIKLGNGSTAWNSLAYWTGGGAWPGGTASEWVAPAVVTVTDSATISVNAAAGNGFRIAFTAGVGASRTIAAPSNPADGQVITFELIQPTSGGPCAVSWTTIGTGAYDFGSGSVPVLSTASSAMDLVSFRYSGAKQRWACLNSGGLGY
jgi:hypothetical protein